jgi:lipoprotein-anchoring transpeptidase ErfK/SrfK
VSAIIVRGWGAATSRLSSSSSQGAAVWPQNPLDTMALYLGNTLYRIHGTNDLKSIAARSHPGAFAS